MLMTFRKSLNGFTQLVNKARELKQQGYAFFGLKAVWEFVRWSPAFRSTKQQGSVKLQDKFQSRYARLIIRNEPDLADFFEIRPLLSEKKRRQIVVAN